MALFTYPIISRVDFDYLLSLIQTCISKFAGTNTMTGSTSATLNQPSGSVTYTGAAAGSSITLFTLTNSYVTTTSLVIPILNYNTSTHSGAPEIATIVKTNGSVVFYIKNTSASATNSNLVIDFLIS